tara:strand:- start:1353 stop:1544 length:192 start_codon:yes stop_codon:yes gene_type:complete
MCKAFINDFGKTSCELICTQIFYSLISIAQIDRVKQSTIQKLFKRIGSYFRPCHTFKGYIKKN